MIELKIILNWFLSKAIIDSRHLRLKYKDFISSESCFIFAGSLKFKKKKNITKTLTGHIKGKIENYAD